jgi:hypothetical protein
MLMRLKSPFREPDCQGNQTHSFDKHSPDQSLVHGPEAHLLLEVETFHGPPFKRGTRPYQIQSGSWRPGLRAIQNLQLNAVALCKRCKYSARGISIAPNCRVTGVTI